MDLEEFEKGHQEFEKTGFPGLCDRRDGNCSPSTLATKYVKFSEKELYLYCDTHAPKDAVALHPSKIDQLIAPTVPEHDSSSGSFAELRSKLNKPLGIRLQSTGEAANTEDEFILMQTLDASPENPILVEFDQHIIEPFTGPGQFDLVERDAIRRVRDGACAGGTPVLTSETMNWQPEDAGQSIKVGLNPGRHYTILSVEDVDAITLSENIINPWINLILTMDGDEASAVTIATKSGFTDGVTTGAHSRFSKALTVDKIYRVVFVPGTAGDGIFSITPPGVLYHTEPVPKPEVQ